jgi:hypothetical protein
MKKLFISADSSQIGLVQSRLDAAGIAYEIRNKGVSGVLPLTPFEAEIWVLQDEEFDTAKSLIESGNASSGSSPAAE